MSSDLCFKVKYSNNITVKPLCQLWSYLIFSLLELGERKFTQIVSSACEEGHYTHIGRLCLRVTWLPWFLREAIQDYHGTFLINILSTIPFILRLVDSCLRYNLKSIWDALMKLHTIKKYHQMTCRVQEL